MSVVQSLNFISNTTGRTYYYNPITDLGSWKQFEELEQPIRLQPHWRIIRNSQGNPYFYSSVTHRSQYNTPEDTVILDDIQEGTTILELHEPLINYYTENGVPLEDYTSIITLLRQLGIESHIKYITTITEGCREPKTPDQIDKLFDLIHRYSPNIISINLSGCYENKSVLKIDKLLFPKLKRVYSYSRLKQLPEDIINISTGIVSWEEYLNQLAESLSTEYNEWEYDYNNEWGFSDLDMVKGFIAQGLDPQQGYDDFIDTLIQHPRYSREFFAYRDYQLEENPNYIGEGGDILKFLFAKGAKPNLSRLLKEDQAIIAGGSKISLDGSIEEESDYIYIKALIIDTLYRINPAYISNTELKQLLPLNWNNIVPLHWEDIEDIIQLEILNPGSDSDYEFKYPNKEYYQLHFWQEFKDMSTFLQKFKI